MKRIAVRERLRLAVKALWKPQSISDLDAQITGTAGRGTIAGVNVSENTALNFLDFFACVRVKANTQAALTVHLYKRQDRGAERLTGERLYYLVHDAPNEDTTSVSWRKAISAHLDTWGNGYTWLDKPTLGRNAGRISRMVTLKPDRVTVRREGGRLKYDYTLVNDDGTKKPVTYDRSQVLHIPGLGYDGVIGYSPVSIAAQGIGLGLALEQFEARWVGQGTHPSAIVTTAANMDQKTFDTWLANLNKQYAAIGNVAAMMALTGDAKYIPMTVPLKDAEFLGQRRFQLEEMARLTGVPLILVQDQEKTSSWGTGVEQIFIGYVMLEALPGAREWEQRMNLSLLTEAERAAGWFFEFDLNSLMRGDNKSRGEFYRAMREIGVMNPNEIREKENMNPREGGDSYYDTGPQGQGQSSQNQAATAALRPVFIDTAARILNRERQDIGAQAERFAKKDDMEGFCGWLGSYWDRHTLYVAEAITPVYAAMGRSEAALNAAKQHVSALQTAVKLAQTGGIDEVKAMLEAREPADCPLFGEV